MRRPALPLLAGAAAVVGAMAVLAGPAALAASGSSSPADAHSAARRMAAGLANQLLRDQIDARAANDSW